MPIAVNIRGTGGSGKSTLVKRIMELYPAYQMPVIVPGRKRPERYILRQTPDAARALIIPGHYETACGGCDTIKTVDQVYDMVRSSLTGGDDVLYEGIMVQDDVTRAVALDKELKAQGGQLHVIRLTTKVEDCLAAIRDRRAARGEEKPLNEKNTRQRYERVLRSCDRLRHAGVAVEALDREAAFARVRELLGV